MAEQYNEQWAQNVIDSGAETAESVIGDPAQVDDLLGQVQDKLSGLPDTVTTAFKNIPLMANMVKSYVTGEYTVVSPKVVISLVSAFLYLVKKKDIIPDNVPVVGLADDLAIIGVVMAINEPELAAYATWREQQGAAAPAAEAAEGAEAPAAAEPAAEAPKASEQSNTFQPTIHRSSDYR